MSDEEEDDKSGSIEEEEQEDDPEEGEGAEQETGAKIAAKKKGKKVVNVSEKVDKFKKNMETATKTSVKILPWIPVIKIGVGVGAIIMGLEVPSDTVMQSTVAMTKSPLLEWRLQV